MSVTDPRFELVMEYLRRLQAGEAITVESFLAEHPDLEPEIRVLLEQASRWPNKDTPTVRKRFAQTMAVEPPEEVRAQQASKKSKKKVSGDTELVPEPQTPNKKEVPIFDGRYRQVEMIGEGGYGRVFLVEDMMHGGERLALKVIRKVHTRGDLEQRFRNEIRVLRALNHSSIPAIFNDGKTSDGEIYYTMTLVEGRTLTDVLAKEAPLRPERITRLALQLLDVLVYAHDMGVVHRDLKPSNIVLLDAGTKKERVQVLDFGIAKVLRHEGLLEQAQTMGTEVPIGTPHYMAPEQVRGHAEDGRTDLYALGIIIYQMCSGRLPFQGKTSMEVLIARLENRPEDLSSDAAPKWLRDLIQTLLRREKEKRPTSREARATFDLALRGKLRDTRRRVLLPALAAVLLTALGLGWTLSRGGGDSKEVATAENPEEPLGRATTEEAPPEGAADSGQTVEVEPEGLRPSPQFVPPEPEELESLQDQGDETFAGPTSIEREPQDPLDAGIDASGETDGVPTEAAFHDTDIEPPREPVVEEHEVTEADTGELDAGRTNEVVNETLESEAEPTDLAEGLAGPESYAIEFIFPDGLAPGARLYSNENEFQVEVTGFPHGLFMWGDHSKVVKPEERTTLQLDDGENRFSLLASSSPGGTYTPTSVFTVVHDTIPPGVDWDLSSPGKRDSLLRYPKLTLTGKASDPEPGQLAGIHLEVTNAGSRKIVDVDIDMDHGVFEKQLELDAGDGEYQLVLTPRDEAKNSRPYEASVVLDTAPPTVVLGGEVRPNVELKPSWTENYAGKPSHPVAVSSWSTTESSCTIEGTVKDAHPAKVTVDGDPLPLNESSPAFEWSTDLQVGKRTVALLAEDGLGNRSYYELVLERNPEQLATLDLQVLSDIEGAGGSLYDSEGIVYDASKVSMEIPIPTSNPEGTEYPTTVRITIPGRPHVRLKPDRESEPSVESITREGDTFTCVLRPGSASVTLRAVEQDLQEEDREAGRLTLALNRPRCPNGFEAAAGARVNARFLLDRIKCPKTGTVLLLVDEGEGEPFYIGRLEVSIAEYEAMDQLPAESSVRSLEKTHPVADIDFDLAEAWCHSIGARLPTVDEWERAAKRDDGQPWWGAHMAGKCNSDAPDDGYTNSSPCGAYREDRSRFGCLDMSGNVREMCTDGNRRTTMGGSYVRSPRETPKTSTASKGHVGFRVAVTAP